MNLAALMQRIERGAVTGSEARGIGRVLTCAVALATAEWEDGAAWALLNRLRAAVDQLQEDAADAAE